MLAAAPHPEDIKAAIRKRHRSVAAFEKKRGLPKGSVLDVIRGRAIKRAAYAIADELQRPVNDLFPGRFKIVPLSHFSDNSTDDSSAQHLNEGAKL